MSVVKSWVYSIEKLLKSSLIVLHASYSVDACWISHDFFCWIDWNYVVKLIIELNTIQADVVVVTMCGVKIYSKSKADRYKLSFVFLYQIAKNILIWNLPLERHN